MAYDKEKVFKEILQDISEGTSLRKVLLKDGMPRMVTFLEWVDASEDKSNQYARAQDLRADVLFDEILDIAYQTETGISTRDTIHGTETTTSDMLGHRRLKIDALKWILARMNSKKYGDKMEIDQKVKQITEIKLTDATRDSDT